MSRIFQYVLPVFGIVVGAGVFVALLMAEALYILPQGVALPAGEELPEWLTGFRMEEFHWVLIPTLVCAVIWMLVCWAKPSYSGDSRATWWVLWVVAAVSALIYIFSSKLLHDTGLLPEVLTLANATIVFWLATAPFSPVTHKYAPAGSSLARSLW
jgi:hypothetical protein